MEYYKACFLKKETTYISNYIDEFHRIVPKKKSDRKERIYCMILFIEVQLQAKLIYDDRSQNDHYFWERKGGGID